MATSRCSSPDDDGYKRFSEEVHYSYGTDARRDEEMGSVSMLNREMDAASGSDHWEMNYHEAAIFLEEGENNEKFDSHPRHPSALPAYLLVHNNWYYGLDLCASLLLLGLALAEEPSVSRFTLPVGVHGTLELVALAIIGVELVLKLQWTGYATVLRHRRTAVKGVALAVMLLEAVVVLVRQESHFRVTRALRPIFLVDTRACGNMRRFIRQIFQSLPPIVDMLALLLFFVASYALLGFYLFSDHAANLYFRTLPDSFVSMFVLLTTANFPDVMMPAYAASRWNAVFFVSYISTVLYVLMNLMLAVVYETFTGIEKDKFRKLLLHKRTACRLAFRLLVAKQTPSGVRFAQFAGAMRYYAPRKSWRDVILMFKQLNCSSSGCLSEEEFLRVYDAACLRWHVKNPPDPSFSRVARRIVEWKYFEHLVYLAIVANVVAMIARVAQPADSIVESAVRFAAAWDALFFLLLFLLEAALRIAAVGYKAYVASGWNCFDLTATLLGLFGAALVRLVHPVMTGVVVLRPLRTFRLFKLKKRYRDIFGTLVLLSPLMCSTAIVMLVMYYFFAVVGMELFSRYDLRDCCANSTVEAFFRTRNNSSAAIGYYYLNNFGDLIASGVTLFELTVVNNWFIIMDAFAAVTESPLSRVYFMAFYLFTMVVLTIVVASVLEAFRFRIQYKRATSKRDEEQMLHEEVRIDWRGVREQLCCDVQQAQQEDGEIAVYVGRRPRTRDVLQRRMYLAEIEKWMMEAEMRERSVDLSHASDS